MKKLFLLSALALVMFTGCLVTTGTYNTALEESEARRARAEKLTQDLEAARTENAKLKNDLADLAAARQSDVERLSAELSELSSKGIMTSKAIEDLKVEKARLDASDKAKSAELAELNDRLSVANKGNETLGKQYSTLKQTNDNQNASLQAKGDEIALLNATLINLTKENDYLKREVERLQLKTGELSAQKEQELANVKTTYESLVKEMQQEIDKGDIKITQALDRLSVNMVEKILFDSGKAEVKRDGLKVLMRVGKVLKGVTDRQIRVEGHTDNVKIGGRLREKYPTNWELSTARAANVVRYLEDKVGIDRKYLSVAGMADNDPVASNDTAEGRAANRRIEIVLLPLNVDKVLEELKK